MKAAIFESEAGWSVFLDALKEKEAIVSDAKLAASLGLTRAFVCSVRKGRKNISLELAHTIFSRLELDFDIENYRNLLIEPEIQTNYRISSKTKKFALLRAAGRCQLCEQNAPFLSPDGTPYLEAHHIKGASRGGSDLPENVVALCPNCHRKMQIAPTPEDRVKLQRLSAAFLEDRNNQSKLSE